MLVHLSSTSPYVCDISVGPIEQADRMALASIRKSITYLEKKESFPQTRTPLKLLTHDEIPNDTNIAPTVLTENNASRQPSLQPVWYTEQTIVDDINEQQRNSMLPTIQSTSPEIEDEIIVKEVLLNQPSLMRKSSTFTIEQQSSINVPAALNESEKENDYHTIMTSTQQPSTKPMRHPTEPSDESFRALEHLLGLGSTTQNITMLTTAQESPKSNHESLSLTMVTPTELINQTTASLHISYAPQTVGSLPSSHNILVMPTIESITDPSMNSTMPPPFLVDSNVTEETTSIAGTVISNQDSFHFTDDEKEETPKDDTNTEEDSNFSFELNDFENNAPEINNDKLQNDIVQPPIITIRAPTSADVAFRALVKPRTSVRLSQAIKIQSPLAKPNENIDVTMSPTIRRQSPRLHRSNISQNSTTSLSEDSSIEEEVVIQSSSDAKNQSPSLEPKLTDDSPKTESEQEPAVDINLYPKISKDQTDSSPNSADEADRSASCSSSFLSTQQDSPVPVDPKMPVLSREYSYNTPTLRTTRLSERRRSILTNNRSQTRTTHSVIPSIPEQQTTTSEEEEKNSSSANTSLSSFPSTTLKPMLSILSTNPTVISEGPPLVLQKSLAGSASPSPNSTPIITIRKSDQLTSSSSPRRSIKPLQSSTPSMRVKSLQLVSIGEQEQVLTKAPQSISVSTSTNQVKMFDKEQQVDVPIQTRTVSHESIQTSPERRPRLINISIQTTPSLTRSASCYVQTSPKVTTTASTLIIEQENQQQVTPINSKAMIHLRRNVRFQFTPSTDARLAAKEKLEEDQKSLKQPVPISTDNEHEEDTEDEIKIEKKPTTSKKKKHLSTRKHDDSSEETTESSPILDQQETINEIPIIEIPPSPKKISKRSKRHENKPSTASEPELVVITSSPIQTKRANRKRPNPKPTLNPPSETPTTSPTEPVNKRAKTTVRVPSPEPLSTRSRSKTPVMSNIPVQSISPSEQSLPSKKSKKNSSEITPVENSNVNHKRKNSSSTIKKTKRRLHSVEQDEGLNTADEDETIPTQSDSIDLSQEEREKIEGLTVAELKARLTKHGENIPKGVRKADLVALLIKIEINLLKEQKQAEIIVIPDTTTSRKTRRKK